MEDAKVIQMDRLARSSLSARGALTAQNKCQIWLFRKGSRLKSNSFLDRDVKQHNISMF